MAHAKDLQNQFGEMGDRELQLGRKIAELKMQTNFSAQQQKALVEVS